MKTFYLTTIGVSVICFSALGSGTVSNLTQADLKAALVGGGTVLFATNGTLTLTNTISIPVDTTLDSKSNHVIISGGNTVRLFQVATNITFAVKGLVLADGHVVAATGDAFGACIWNQGGHVTLTGCALANNSVQGGNDGNGGNGFGAALCTIGGSLSITNCSITSNRAVGGIVPYSVMRSELGQAMGGAIYSQGTELSLQGVALSNNTVTGGTPSKDVSMLFWARSGTGFGGALYATNSTLTMSSCLVQSNTAYGGAPPLPQPLTPVGAGSGDGDGGGLFVCQDSMCVISDCTFLNNSAIGGPGARNYGGGSGQGGDVFSNGHLQLQESTFSKSQTTGGGNSLGPGVARGGAIYSTGVLSINGCAFVNSFASGGDSGYAFAYYGGAAEGGVLWSSGILACTNSTITASRVLGGIGGIGTPGGAGTGGGLYLTNATAVLLNLTLAANRADGTNIHLNFGGPALGGNLAVTNATVTVLNSIIADSGNGGDVWGSVTDGGYNICSDGTANFSAPGSLNQADPLLAALSDNGGPTPTMALLVGSPARDAIISGFPPVDQRRVSRPQGPAADIGAFEADFISTAPSIVTQPIPQAVRAGTNVIFTVGASGTKPLYYQWRKDGNLLTGATSSMLSLLNVQSTNAGTYSALVTNSFGSAASQGALLAVDSTPIILSQPISVVVSPQEATNFSVVADGPSLVYQWWHYNAPVPGGTAATLNITSAVPGTQGSYSVVVSNFANSVTSTVATLSFDASALSILVPPKDATVETGYAVNFSVQPAGIPPFAYQWEHNGQAIPGATSSSYTISAVTTNFAGTYDVVVTNGYLGVTSPTALLTVTPGPVPPLLVPARFGQSLTITFNAEAGRTYRLLSSTNSNSWRSLSTNSALSAGPLQFIQPIMVSNNFYRVVTP